MTQSPHWVFWTLGAKTGAGIGFLSVLLRMCRLTDRLRTLIAGPDADDPRQVRDEDLTVTDLAGAGALDNGLDRGFNEVVVDRDIEADLSQKVPALFGTAVIFVDALLPSMAQTFTDGDQVNVRLIEGF